MVKVKKKKKQAGPLTVKRKKAKREAAPVTDDSANLLDGLKAILEDPDAVEVLAQEAKSTAGGSDEAGASSKRKRPKGVVAKGADTPGEGGGATPSSSSVHTGKDHLHPYKVFVNGLPWSILRETVVRDFGACGEIERLDMPKNSTGLSSGSAFIYFKNDAAVEAALKFDGVDYHGRTIKVVRAVRQQKSAGKVATQELFTVVVDNLPVDTDPDGLRSVFEACGDIEAVRMAKDSGGRFKGTAFLVFRSAAALSEALERNGDEYQGNIIEVRKPRQSVDKGKGKGKGKGGKGKPTVIKDSRRRICHAFTLGKCIWGPNCRYVHK